MSQLSPATAQLASISPLFIVADLERAVAVYRDHLGFEVAYRAPEPEPFFAIVRREGVQILLKVIDADTGPLPNRARHAFARWDAFVHAPDPDALAAELAARGATFSAPLANTGEALRGFEIEDADGYVLFFGRPR